MVSDLLKSSSDLYCICMVFIADCHDHVFMLRKLDSSSDKCFVKCFIKCLRNSKTLSCRLHLRSKADISSADLLKGEYRHLNRYIISFRLKSRCVTKIFDLLSCDNLCCQWNDRDTCYLTDIWYCTAGTWVYLDNIYIVFAAHDKLDIDHTDNME